MKSTSQAIAFNTTYEITPNPIPVVIEYVKGINKIVIEAMNPEAGKVQLSVDDIANS